MLLVVVLAHVLLTDRNEAAKSSRLPILPPLRSAGAAGQYLVAGLFTLGPIAPPHVPAGCLGRAMSEGRGLVRFECNVCGRRNRVERSRLGREAPTCMGCRSTVRLRSVVHLLSTELFGESLSLRDFPESKGVSGIGLGDWRGYAGRLAEVFSYVNTYHRGDGRGLAGRLAAALARMKHERLRGEVRFDVTKPGRGLAPADFLIASEVFEHVPPPVGAAFSGAFNALRPGGLLVLTVPFDRRLKQTIEHFPELNDWRVVRRRTPLAWRRKSRPRRFDLIDIAEDGRERRFADVRLHGGAGVTLEMRVFALSDLMARLAAAGFADVSVRDDDRPDRGVVWLSPNSTPIVARRPLVGRP